MTMLAVEPQLPRVEPVGICDRLHRFVTLIVAGQTISPADRLNQHDENEPKTDEECCRNDVALFHTIERAILAERAEEVI
jgi:hypothetical protein